MSLLDRDLILPKVNAVDAADIIRTLASRLEGKGLVKESFIDAVLAREEVYPTGLPTNGVFVAIPHADPAHVNGRSAIALATLNQPVTFRTMGDPTQQVDVEIVVMLAIHNPDEHIKLLKSLMKLFVDQELLLRLVAVESQDEIIGLLSDLDE